MIGHQAKAMFVIAIIMIALACGLIGGIGYIVYQTGRAFCG